VRRLYSKWEQGTLSSSGFKAELKMLGIPPTDELDHLLVVYGPSRAMPFRKLMYALQIEENDGRRARNAHHGGRQAEPPTTAADFVRDPHLAGEACDWSGAGGARGGDPTSASLRKAICDFVDGRIPAVAFRQQLRRCGVNMTSTLDRLIRTHECDNSVRFQDLARLLILQDKREQLAEVHASSHPRTGGFGPEPPVPSGMLTPGSSAGGYGPVSGAAPPGGPGNHPPGSRTPSDFRFGTPPDPRGGYPAQPAHRGQRQQDDVGSLLIHSQCSGRSRSAASASHGHRHLDDTRSVASHQASDGWDPGTYDEAYCSAPPFATTWDLNHPPQQRPAPRAASTSRVVRTHGDIIGWKDRYEEPLPPPPRGGTAAEALMRWPVSERGQEEAPSRYGKRYYGAHASAGDAAPFGRVTDVVPSGQRRPPPTTPFGTDQDYGIMRPEDAGTDEYRCAINRNRLAC